MRRIAIALLAVCLFVAAAAPVAAGRPQVATPAPPGAAGRPQALVFFNAFCVACRADAARVRAWSLREQRRYMLLGVGFMMSTRDSRAFAGQLGWRFPVQGDPNGSLAEHYGIWSPTVILLVDGGRVTRVNYASW